MHLETHNLLSPAQRQGHTHRLLFQMSLRPFVDVLYVERALQMSYGFSTRLTHANKISIGFKANK